MDRRLTPPRLWPSFAQDREETRVIGSTLSRRQITGLIAAAGAFAAVPAFAQRFPDAPPDDADSGAPSAQVPTGSDRSSHVTAPVSINGQGPYQFVVDTGANRSCLSQRLAQKLELPPGPVAAVNTLAGRRLRPTVAIERLQVGPRSQRRIHAPLLPLDDDVDGVLAIDWLKGQRLVLGFQGRRLEITASRREAPRPNRVVAPARRRHGQLTIVDADLGGARINAMVDSGAQVSLGNAALRAAFPRSELERARSERVMLESIAGERFSGDLLYLPFLRLGGLRLGNVPVVFAQTHVFALWGLADAPTLILGLDLLTQFTEVAVDFGRSTVRFDFTRGQAPESMQP